MGSVTCGKRMGEWERSRHESPRRHLGEMYRKNACVTYGKEWVCDIWERMGVWHMGENG